MERYLIDNNSISHYFSELFTEKGMKFMAEMIDRTPNISVITQIEALSWISPYKQKEKAVKEFINDSIIFEMNPQIVKRCIKIRRSQKIKTPDAIIAATAMINNMTLISNDKGFKNIIGLKVIDPHSL